MADETAQRQSRGECFKLASVVSRVQSRSLLREHVGMRIGLAAVVVARPDDLDMSELRTNRFFSERLQHPFDIAARNNQCGDAERHGSNRNYAASTLAYDVPNCDGEGER
jgi:hypothetical protein